MKIVGLGFAEFLIIAFVVVLLLLPFFLLVRYLKKK